MIRLKLYRCYVLLKFDGIDSEILRVKTTSELVGKVWKWKGEWEIEAVSYVWRIMFHYNSPTLSLYRYLLSPSQVAPTPLPLCTRKLANAVRDRDLV